MHRLRQARFLARLVLAWFALALGAAIASPLVKPQSLELVCSASGATKLLATDAGEDNGTAPALHHGTLDCPLCLFAGAPPPVVVVDLPSMQPLGHAVQPIVAARIAVLTAAPLPARGPPSIPSA
ncbi:MAG TPA: DUF2946 family protein [Ramlibacter sp.]|uniref:DUF2946 family protein n=1 Tax=Ramlibacter sp. TaxID=1917967 RepID=UPI002BC94C9F|nr:DUF2946 family protein [Ramlibacter sp.]HVZ42633.1 DUF2946 family protein [Ramlibacter sp.]